MNNKLLTVIVPSYNMEEYLPKCLGSLIVPDEALLQRLDVIVVNDGSKDRTSEIAHQFERDHPGIFRVIDKKNGNYGSCINSALPKAKGFYVKVLDADDSVDTGNFLQLLSVTNEECVLGVSAADLIITDYARVSGHNNVNSIISYVFPHGGGHLLSEAILDDNRFTIHSIVYRTDMVRASGYRQSEGISYTDTEWIIEPMSSVHFVHYLPIPVTRYLLGRSGQTMELRNRISHFQDIVLIAQNLIAHYSERKRYGVAQSLPYYEHQVLRVIYSVYYSSLFGIDGHPVNCDVSAFDMRLGSFPQLYASVGETRFPSQRFPLPYVAAWRRGGARRCVTIAFLKMLLLAKRFLHWRKNAT